MATKTKEKEVAPIASHARDNKGNLVRVQTLAVNMADLEYKVE